MSVLVDRVSFFVFGWQMATNPQTGDEHWVPVSDIYAHHFEDCGCGAKPDPLTGVIVHHAWDDRESYEIGTRQLH
jgi:hypothetical protein